MGFATFEDLADALAAGFDEGAAGACGVVEGEEVDEDVVAGAGAVGHFLEREGARWFTGACKLQAVGEESEPDRGVGDRVVAVDYRVDDGFLDRAEVVEWLAVRAAGAREAHDESDRAVNLVRGASGLALLVDQVDA